MTIAAKRHTEKFADEIIKLPKIAKVFLLCLFPQQTPLPCLVCVATNLFAWLLLSISPSCRIPTVRINVSIRPSSLFNVAEVSSTLVCSIKGDFYSLPSHMFNPFVCCKIPCSLYLFPCLHSWYLAGKRSYFAFSDFVMPYCLSRLWANCMHFVTIWLFVRKVNAVLSWKNFHLCWGNWLTVFST